MAVEEVFSMMIIDMKKGTLCGDTLCTGSVTHAVGKNSIQQ